MADLSPTNAELAERKAKRRDQLVDGWDSMDRVSRRAALDDFEQIVRWQDRRAMADGIRKTHGEDPMIIASEIESTTERRPPWA